MQYNSEPAPIVNPINVTISIDYPKKADLEDVKDADFKVEEGASVLDAIQLYCNVNELPINVETTSSSIIGINDVNNGDYNSKTWQYKINGELCDTDVSEKILKDGDSIQWVYMK